MEYAAGYSSGATRQWRDSSAMSAWCWLIDAACMHALHCVCVARSLDWSGIVIFSRPCLVAGWKNYFCGYDMMMPCLVAGRLAAYSSGASVCVWEGLRRLSLPLL